MKRVGIILSGCLGVFGILQVLDSMNDETVPKSVINMPHLKIPTSTGLVVIEPVEKKQPDEPDLIVQDLIDQHCLALTIYGEARGETAEGMAAVAWVVMTRVKRRQSDPCTEVLRRNQFEAFKKGSRLRKLAIEAQDGELTFPSMNNRWIQNKINQIAHQVYTESIPDPTNGATHFFAPKAQKLLGRKAPYWSQKLTYMKTAGNHKFYKEG